jgi:hypothetical protein
MTDEVDTPAEHAVTMDRLTKVYIKMRDKRAQLSREFEEADAAIKAQQEEVSNAMKDIIRTAGGTGMKTSYGTVALKTSTRFFVQDWEAMGNFVVEQNAPFLLEKRIAQRMMQEFLDKNPSVVPPGLNTMSEITVSVTKPRAKA